MKTKCYECGYMAYELSSTSRCIRCTERRLNFNLSENALLRKELGESKDDIKSK